MTHALRGHLPFMAIFCGQVLQFMSFYGQTAKKISSHFSGSSYGYEHKIIYMYVWPEGRVQTGQIFSQGRGPQVRWVRQESLEAEMFSLERGSQFRQVH